MKTLNRKIEKLHRTMPKGNRINILSSNAQIYYGKLHKYIAKTKTLIRCM